jgi:hypothetical protein
MDEQSNWQPNSIPLRLDPEAESSDPSLPAFLARPEGAPVYHGFPLLEQSRTEDGWCFGIISGCDCPEGRKCGDAFVVAPDNSRAGIIWDVRADGIDVSIPPGVDRWGVYCLRVEHPVHDEQELVDQLQNWLPELRRLHLQWQAERSSS